MVVIVERRAGGKQHHGEESITNNCFNNFLNWFFLNHNCVINNTSSYYFVEPDITLLLMEVLARLRILFMFETLQPPFTQTGTTTTFRNSQTGTITIPLVFFLRKQGRSRF